MLIGRAVLGSLLLGLGCAGLWPIVAQGALPRVGAFAPGQVLVGYDTALPALDSVAHTSLIGTIPGLRMAIVRVSPGRESEALQTLRRYPQVRFAELDYGAHTSDAVVPNDPGWPLQWGPDEMEAPTAWGVTTGTPDTVMAVLDSGVQLDHEDLAARLWANPGEIPGNGLDDDLNGKVDDLWGWHFYHAWDGQAFMPREDRWVADDNGHGTHVAGTVGAAINNGVGVAGMAGGGRLMAVKVLDQYGWGWYSDIAQGIVYAVDNGAQVINLSAGGEMPSQALQDVADYARAHGVLLVAAVGNDGGPVRYPAACDGVLAVAAVDRDSVRPSFSNYGPAVDVAAPGVDIYSTWWRREGYFARSGTSAAAPHVAGLAALLWSARPDLAVAQVTRLITNTAEDVNADDLPGWDEYLGWGRVKAGRSLSAAMVEGDIYLDASRWLLSVGDQVVVTATAPATHGLEIRFTASGGTVCPGVTDPTGDGVTTVFTAGVQAGMASVTATDGASTGTLFLRLLPGRAVSTTLTPGLGTVRPGASVPLTLTATDAEGNPPLDGTAVHWTARGGHVSPSDSVTERGMGWAVFTADGVPGSAVITAGLEVGAAVTTALAIGFPCVRYLPVILLGL